MTAYYIIHMSAQETAKFVCWHSAHIFPTIHLLPVIIATFQAQLFLYVSPAVALTILRSTHTVQGCVVYGSERYNDNFPVQQ